MPMSQHVLFIPVEGAIEAIHFPLDGDIYIRALLLERGGEGAYVAFDLKVDEEESGRLAFMAPLLLAQAVGKNGRNNRAEKALSFLTRTHMVIPGPACFINIDPTDAAVIASGDHERTTS